MRIISSFRDYYDTVQAYDADRETLFLREQSKVEIPEGTLELDTKWFNSFNRFYPRVVGFCGKLYNFYWFNDTVKAHGKHPEYKIEGAIQYVYNKDEIIHNLSLTREGKKELEDKRFEKKLKLQNFNIIDIPESLRQYNPIFYAKRKDGFKDEILLNPILSKLTFYRIKDVATAYQEIRMWIENQAVPEKPIPYIDDVTMAEAKGFNRFSFRKDKSK